MTKSYEEINEKIRKGKAVVLTAEEVSEMARTMSPKEILDKVDVVTTATFGAMCSSGAFLNFGHANPPIRMERIEINGVPVSGGLAAVDTFVGATDCNPQNPTYGGAHIIQELIDGKELTLEAWGKGTDCYPRKHIKTSISLKTINEAILMNPRNAYQNYNVAVRWPQSLPKSVKEALTRLFYIRANIMIRKCPITFLKIWKSLLLIIIFMLAQVLMVNRLG